jgi:undecaprenyl-diphosphatase
MLGTLILTFYKPPRVRKLVVQAIAGLIVLAIGVSRIYLGVHYPSDVIGGYAAGIAWLAICLTGIRLARERSKTRDAVVVSAYAK